MRFWDDFKQNKMGKRVRQGNTIDTKCDKEVVYNKSIENSWKDRGGNKKMWSIIDKKLINKNEGKRLLQRRIKIEKRCK